MAFSQIFDPSAHRGHPGLSLWIGIPPQLHEARVVLDRLRAITPRLVQFAQPLEDWGKVEHRRGDARYPTLPLSVHRFAVRRNRIPFPPYPMSEV